VLKKERKNHDIYYLLPGMSRGARRRSRRNLLVGLGVGLFLSAIMWLIYLILRRP